MPNKQFSFLLSNRFWSNIITSASVILIDPNFSTQVWYVTMGKFLGLLSAAFTLTATVDRTVDVRANAIIKSKK